LGDLPRWLPLDPKAHQTATEIEEDNMGCRFVLLSACKVQKKSRDPELGRNLAPLLWECSTIPTSWLRHVFGPSMGAVQAIVDSSNLAAIYRCLDCEVPFSFQPGSRDLTLRRQRSLESICKANPGEEVVPTTEFSDLLCPLCLETRICDRKRRIEELQAMPYRKYLKSPEWQILRKMKLRQDGSRCRLCPSKGPLEVHHALYSVRGDEGMDTLVVLCHPCHQRHHGVLLEAS
jgi:hypothetical protein